MYAVIRTGGKQYRVAPGDVISIEKTPAEGGTIEFTDVLAVGGNDDGGIEKPAAATVTGTVLAEERGDKILVFHFKRKKQYKKLLGHRQSLTRVRIAEISVDGQSFTAPEGGKSFAPKTSHAPQHAEAKLKSTGPRAQRAGAAEEEAAPRAAAATKSAAKKKARKK
jgi:large subunit ribosomal protein L21